MKLNEFGFTLLNIERLLMLILPELGVQSKNNQQRDYDQYRGLRFNLEHFSIQFECFWIYFWSSHTYGNHQNHRKHK